MRALVLEGFGGPLVPRARDKPVAGGGEVMRALLLVEFGGPLVPRELAKPVAGEGQVLVRVEASGVNPLDTKIRAGQAGHAQSKLPAVLGLDLAGGGEAVGARVTDFRPGDAVYGMTGGVGDLPGSLAEY